MAEAKVKQAVKVDFEAGTITMDYPELGKAVVIKPRGFAENIRDGLLFHGMKQIAVDCGAGKTAAEAHAQLTKRLEAFSEGEWRAEGERDTTSAVIAAVVRAYKGKWTAEQLTAVAEKKPEEVKRWRADAKVKLALAKMREEKAREAAKAQDEELDIEV